MRGDLNLTLGPSERWGGKIHLDPLVDYFLDIFHEVDLVDILPTKLHLTWHNGRVGNDYIGRRLDMFLCSGSLIELLGRHRTWVSLEALSDHCLILLQFEMENPRTSVSFKFNHVWLQDPDFCALVKNLWETLGPSNDISETNHFMTKLSRLKREVIK